MRRLFSTLVALAAVQAAGADFRGSARLWVGPAFDSNARRDFVSPGTPTASDAFFYTLGQLQGAVDFERARALGAYDLGFRLFALLPSENTVVQSAQVESEYALGHLLSVGLAGRVRDRRGAERDYTDAVGELMVKVVPDDAVELQLRGGPHRFLFYPRFAYSYSAPDFSVSARYRLNRRHSLGVFGNATLRTYNAQTNADPKDPEPPPAVTRKDSALLISLTYSYRGPFHLTVGYSYFDESSNSFGETMRRHRFSATAGLRLPLELTLLVSGALQLTDFPDGVFLSQDLLVVEDEENASSVTVKLVRPIAKHFELDARYALYVNLLQQNNFSYLRQVVSVGAAVTF